MDALIKSSAITSILFLIDRWGFKKFNSFFYYILIFSILFGVNFFYPAKAHAYEFTFERSFTPSAYIERNALEHLHYDILSPKERIYYEAKAKQFYDDANWCLKEAEKKCIYLPTRKNREYTRGVIVTALTALATKDAKSTMIVGVLNVLGDYFQDVYDEWEDIRTKLNWAKYYLEMYEFYTEILNNPNV